MKRSLKLQISTIRIGKYTKIYELEEFLYNGGMGEDLTAEKPKGNDVNQLPLDDGLWVVNPSFYHQTIHGRKCVSASIEEGENWSFRAMNTALTELERKPARSVYLAAANHRGDVIVLREGYDFAPDQPAVEVKLLNLQDRTSEVFTACEQVGHYEFLNLSHHSDGERNAQSIKQDEWLFSQSSNCSFAVNPFQEQDAFTELFQWVRGYLAIQHRTHYGFSQAVGFDNLLAYTRSVPWFLRKDIEKRSVLLLGEGLNSEKQSIQLRESSVEGEGARFVIQNPKVRLFLLSGQTSEEILARIHEMQSLIQSGMTFEDIETQSLSLNREASKFTLAIIADNRDSLANELKMSLKGVPSSFERGKDWQSRGGSFFTPKPLGKDAKIAFVFPGAFNSYVGMGAELLHSYPFLHDWLSEHTEDAEENYQALKVFPPSWGAASEKELAELNETLLEDPLSMFISGMAIAGLYTYLLRNGYNIQPDAAFGYSLGETGMFFANDFWHQTGEIAREISSLPLFHNRLAGRNDAVREYWDAMGYSYSSDSDDGTPIWDNYILMTTFEKAQKVVGQEPQVYITHINADRQMVIGGEPEACKRVISELHCMSFPIPFHYPMHCEAVASEYETLRDLHLRPVECESDIQFYSSYECAPFILESSQIASSIAGGLCNRVDFSSLVRQVYDDGYEIFIEVGARSNCTKWIERILKTKDICAVSVNQAEVADEINLMRVIAHLVSHGKPVNLHTSV
ncbi:MAG: hypothetical protein J7K85_03740 [Anaerolineaceae bacterium]|nr:hypothetical protein [Anaerolineaceae bacterium]